MAKHREWIVYKFERADGISNLIIYNIELKNNEEIEQWEQWEVDQQSLGHY